MVSGSGNIKDEKNHTPEAQSTAPVFPQMVSDPPISPVERAIKPNSNSSGNAAREDHVQDMSSASESRYKFSNNSSNSNDGEYLPSVCPTTPVLSQMPSQFLQPPSPRANADAACSRNSGNRIDAAPIVQSTSEREVVTFAFALVPTPRFEPG